LPNSYKVEFEKWRELRRECKGKRREKGRGEKGMEMEKLREGGGSGERDREKGGGGVEEREKKREMKGVKEGERVRVLVGIRERQRTGADAINISGLLV